ncbi:MAG: histidine phosphatase family protein [Paracoccaceae bacterium]
MTLHLPKIWFLRHGQTHWNAERRIQGQLESELTEQGRADARQQAVLMASVLSQYPPCYVSPLGRAQETAQIALSGAQFQTDARLSEAHAGAWQGMLHDDVRRDFPTLVRPESSALELFLVAPGGEGYERFKARIVDFLSELNKPSVIVAHGLLGQVMRGLVLGLELSQMGQLSNGQGCVYVLENGREEVLRR